MATESYGTAVPLQQLQAESRCLISKQDWELIQQGNEAERERGYRNLFLGIALSCGLGILSPIVSRFDLLISVGIAPMESAFLILMSSVTLTSATLAFFFHQRIRRARLDNSLSALAESIRLQLEHPETPNDPRQWP